MKPSKPSDLTEHFVSGSRVFDGNLLKVHRDTVRLPDGTQGTREYIRHPGAVAVVALFDDGAVLLERQFRYPHRREFIEVPAGKLEPGEPPMETAKRELLEETGYVAEHWKPLGVIHTAIAYTDEAIHLFLAQGLTEGTRKLDAGEFLEILKVPYEKSLAMIRDGRITDCKTVAGLLWVSRWATAADRSAGRKGARAAGRAAKAPAGRAASRGARR